MENQFYSLHPAVQVSIIAGVVCAIWLWFKFLKEMSE